MVTDTIPAICTGIRVTLPAGRFPSGPATRHWMGTVPLSEMATVSVAWNWTPPELSNRSPAETVPFPMTVSAPTA